MILPQLFRRKKDPVFFMPLPLSGERRDVEQAFTRTFSSDDGKTVLGHLQAMTFARAYGADVPEAQLRYAEGQRALVASILRLVMAGRGN